MQWPTETFDWLGGLLKATDCQRWQVGGLFGFNKQVLGFLWESPWPRLLGVRCYETLLNVVIASWSAELISVSACVSRYCSQLFGERRERGLDRCWAEAELEV